MINNIFGVLLLLVNMDIEKAREFIGKKVRYFVKNSPFSNIKQVREINTKDTYIIIAVLENELVCNINLLRDENGDKLK